MRHHKLKCDRPSASVSVFPTSSMSGSFHLPGPASPAKALLFSARFSTWAKSSVMSLVAEAGSRPRRRARMEEDKEKEIGCVGVSCCGLWLWLWWDGARGKLEAQQHCRPTGERARWRSAESCRHCPEFGGDKSYRNSRTLTSPAVCKRP